MGELVSIVFTSYNHREYLEQALESILHQTYPNIEVIIVDDCSTDGSQEILKKYADHPWVKLHLLEKNTGSYVKSSNYGAARATGKYLLFAQCDDFCEPYQVERLIAPFSQHPELGIVFSKSYLVDKNGTVFGTDFDGRENLFKEKCAQDTLISSAEMRRFLSFSCVIPNLSAALMKRELYNDVNGLPDKYRMAADWAFWLDLAEITSFYYVTAPLNYFRQHDTTIRSKTKIVTQVDEIYNIFYKHISQYKLQGKERSNMRIGAGTIWCWYAIDNPKVWWKNFPSLFKTTFAFEKLNLFYLAAGFSHFVKERLNRPKVQ